jgi:lipopolysaccharide heptosyltransferase I
VRLLVVRLGALGDLVHTVPAVAALTAALPDADVDWLVDARHRAVLDLFALNVRPVAIEATGLPSAWRALRQVRMHRYDVALDFQGLLKSGVLARGSGARRVIGFTRHALRESTAAMFYTGQVDPAGAVHVIEKNLALLRALGITDTTIRVPLKTSPKPVGALSTVVLNPGAGWPNKRWGPEKFGALASALRASRGLRSLVTWGPGERELAASVVENSGGAADVAPPTTVSDLTQLLANAVLVVSGDTGPIHLAAAAGAPIVGIYGPTDPGRNGPWSREDITVSRFATCVCHHKRRCQRASRCLDEIAVDEVRAAAEARLDRAARTGA